MSTTDPNISNLPALGAATVSIPDTGTECYFTTILSPFIGEWHIVYHLMER